ncbi:MAG: hypothetical protein P4L51_27345 [Puia sp.]|nr:hypothetical protein [Puia sp.]
MTLQMQHIIRHLFQANSLDEVPRERLEELVEQYPSFGVGHYLLSKKLQAQGSDRFLQETAKTNLYFINPYWLEWLLGDTGKPPGERLPLSKRVAGNGQTADGPSEPVTDAVAAPIAELVAVVVTETETLKFPDTGSASGTAPVPGDPIGSVTEESTKMHPPAEHSVVSEAGELVTAEEAAPVTGFTTGQDDIARVATPVVPTEEEREQPWQQEAEKTEREENEGPIVDEEAVVLQQEDLPATEILAAHQELSRDELSRHSEEITGEREPVASSGATLSEPLPSEETAHEAVVVPEEITPAGEPAGPAVEVPIETPAQAGEELRREQPASAAPPEPVLAIDPYHTIDYFASQGIRLVLDDNPSDKLGKQLKSFTEWLRVMKRLPQKQEEPVTDPATEHRILAFAAHSNETREIVTETMAEVLAMQGMLGKAADVYRKLSLLNPDKSAYFAAKIEQLKVK